MRKNKFRVEEKYIALTVIFSIVCFLALGILGGFQIRRLLMEDYKNDAMEFARIAAAEIDGDEFASITSTEDVAYKKIYAGLEKYQGGALITYIYAMREMGPALVFVVDPDSEDPAGFLEEYDAVPGMRKALLGEVTCDEELNEDRWGKVLSAYAPIYDAYGRVTGIVGVDMVLDTMVKRMKEVCFAIGSLAAILAFVIVLLLSHSQGRLLFKDVLTGMGNHDLLLLVVNKKHRRGSLQDFAIIHADIKDFKFINRKLGTVMGNRIIIEVARRCKALLKKDERCFGNGKDELYFLVKSERAEEFLKSIQNMEIKSPTPDTKAEPVYIRFRCGVYNVAPEVSGDLAVLYADLALAAAKRQNEKLIFYFENSMLERLTEEKNILQDYEVALEKDEFQVFYQPKVDIRVERLYGAEALVRWIKDGKVISPGKFVPVLEDNNLITELDFYVFERVCQNIRKWLQMDIPVVRISSNFSKLHLKNPHFADRVLEIMDRYNIAPKYIEIELTESSGYFDYAALIDFVCRMKARGVHIAVDDFGVGYSSLSLLQDLKAETVKIDKAFFDHMLSGDERDILMVENMIRMLKDMNFEIICEGIETREQIEFLRAMDSPYVQGYYYDKPLSHDMFERRLIDPTGYRGAR